MLIVICTKLVKFQINKDCGEAAKIQHSLGKTGVGKNKGG